VRGIDVSPLDANLLDVAVRLIRLLDAPAEAPMLMPLITREIIYRLLADGRSERTSPSPCNFRNSYGSRKPAA
jgi:hypothetical protein